jgi:hypothetical protein
MTPQTSLVNWTMHQRTPAIEMIGAVLERVADRLSDAPEPSPPLLLSQPDALAE